jgi:DNA-binding transcriptional regulator/RsmH inhibitor MraZ
VAEIGQNLVPGAAKVEPPLGIFTAKCDDKGRLKFPADFLTYLKGMAVEKVFITTVDLKLVRIYSKDVWERNQILFQAAGDDAEIAQDIAFIANLYGAYSEIDDSGRVLVPTELRRKLEIEGQPVWLDYFNGRINVFGKKVYEERMQRAMVNLGDKVKAFEKKGFN